MELRQADINCDLYGVKSLRKNKKWVVDSAFSPQWQREEDEKAKRC